MNRWVIRLAKILIILIPLGIALVFVGIQVSSLPGFCGFCHIMKPYYESWRTSSHNEVICAECHIAPGIVSELEKKFEAATMVISYFVGTYGTNPWAEIPDESCLRAGCHEKRLLLGREVYKGILFDHRPHLEELRREKRLRCTSCHSQIVQGQHITVTYSTCYLCHFKETKLGEGPASCTLCHETPEKIITTAGLAFNHADVKRFGMDCILCHAGVVKGEGEVLPERCYTCHSEPERLARYKEAEFMHKVHVTDHKVECLSCHIEIFHKVPEQLEAVATTCNTCHGEGHSPTRDLYLGIGGKGAEPQPSLMYLAGVSCEGCHILPKGVQKTANEVSCMSCHGAKYFKIYQAWKETMDRRLAAVVEQLRYVQGKVKVSKADAAAELIKRAQENMEFVQRGRGIHNPSYASSLLRQAYQDLSAALVKSGIKLRLKEPWEEAPYQTRCTRCHLGAEYIKKEAFGQEFTHLPHVVNGRIECSRCHQGQRYPEPAHGALKFSNCSSCHPTKEQMQTASAQDCLACHQAKIEGTSKFIAFPHDMHIDLGLECAICHQGVKEADHLEFLSSKTARPQLSHGFCGSCHAADIPPQGSDCLKCHIRF